MSEDISPQIRKLINTFNSKRDLEVIGHESPNGHPNEKNPKWKGDKVGYHALHAWIGRKLGKASFCVFNEEHTNRQYEWANISKTYKRDFLDWMPLCKSCHVRFDFSEKTRQKMSAAKKGIIPWNKGKEGVFSPQTLERMSLAKLGHKAGMTGKKHSEETKIKISETKLKNKVLSHV